MAGEGTAAESSDPEEEAEMPLQLFLGMEQSAYDAVWERVPYSLKDEEGETIKSSEPPASVRTPKKPMRFSAVSSSGSARRKALNIISQ